VAANKNRAVYGVLLLVFLFFIILMIFASYTVNVFNKESGESSVSAKKKGSIAVVEVAGVIMDSRKVVELLHLAEKDKTTKAIILRINSPGGAVGPTQEIYEEIRRIDSSWDLSNKKEGKPIFASFGTVAASGGYYLGAATRRIYASAGTLTGSIGVIMQFLDASKLAEKVMVNQKNIKAGRYKDIGSPTRAMTMEEEGLMQGMVSGVHKQFIRDILKTRKNRLKADIIELAQGQIFSGEEAYKKGLVDELAGLWTAGRRIHKELNLKGKFGFKYIKKKKEMSFWELLENIEEASTNLNLFSWMSKTPVLLYQ
jgi:protease IV